MKKVQVIISGDVQGVGFRMWILRHARHRRLMGWVKNRDDGAVEAVFYGPEENVQDMVELCHVGPEISWVEDVKVTEEEPLDEFDDFEILE